MEVGKIGGRARDYEVERRATRPEYGNTKIPGRAPSSEYAYLRHNREGKYGGNSTVLYYYLGADSRLSRSRQA